MTRLRSTAMAACALALAACDKDAVQDITAPLAGARVKFFNFGVNAPGVNFYANDTKMTAITSATGAESTTGTVYGGVGSGGLYSAIAPGQYTITGRIAAAVDKDLPVVTLPVTIADGKAYSIYASGFYNTATKTVDGFMIEDALETATDATMAHVRFVNAISNSSPMTLYARNTASVGLPEVAIGGPVPYKSAGAFTAVTGGIYDLTTRVAGAGTSAITRTAVTFVPGRVYTIGARGDMTVTSTTAATRPFLDNTLNR